MESIWNRIRMFYNCHLFDVLVIPTQPACVQIPFKLQNHFSNWFPRNISSKPLEPSSIPMKTTKLKQQLQRSALNYPRKSRPALVITEIFIIC